MTSIFLRFSWLLRLLPAGVYGWLRGSRLLLTKVRILTDITQPNLQAEKATPTVESWLTGVFLMLAVFA